MSESVAVYQADEIIRTIRGQKVILDSDLARIYGVEVKRLNEQVKRNRDRFPADFAFQLTAQEVAALRSQIATLHPQHANDKEVTGNRSQIATGSFKHRDPRFRPHAFTEHGAIMAATVLNSPKAVEMSVFVVRAFVKMREQLLTTATLAQRLAEVERTLLTHDAALRDLYQKLRPLLLPTPEPPRKSIGFGACHAKPDGRSMVKERRAQYRVPRRRPGGKR
jgi:hypothetical protein